MTDRIANVWVERIPFGLGADWLVRVGRFLENGVSEEDVDRWVQPASTLHSSGDAYEMAVRDGRIVAVRGRGMDRVNKGRLVPRTSSAGRPITPKTASPAPWYVRTASWSNPHGTRRWA